MLRGMRLVLTLCLLSIPVGQAVAGPARQNVNIPLAKSDFRFGDFYVKRLGSILIRADKTKPTPAIVFLHGCGGIGGQGLVTAEIDAAHFASLGYATLILDTNDDRKLGETPCNDRAISFALPKARIADLDTAADWLTTNNIALPGKIVALGVSLGGEVVLEHAQEGLGEATLAGGIAYYPGCDRGGQAYARYPFLMLSGGKDMTDNPRQSVAEICAEYAKAAKGNGSAPVEAVSYPNALHGFDIVGLPKQVSQSLNKATSGSDPEARKASLAKIDSFLAEVLK